MSSSALPYPKFRDDVAVSRRADGEGVSYVLNDPRAHRFFRFGEAEMFLAHQLDGDTPPEEVRRRAEERFETSLSLEAVSQFVNRLGALGLLEATDGNEAPTARDRHRSGRIRGNLLYLRWKAWDPDRLLDILHRRLRFFFTPGFLMVSAGLMVVAAGVAIADWGMVGKGIPRMLRFDVLLAAWMVLIGILVLHEFAHGLTCKHFGGRVYEMGVMLIFFQPAMYCNVSDAWMFPEKSKRLWVTFSGAYFEMFLWAVATLVWRVSDPATFVHFVAFLIMITSGIKTVFNLNPLIKLDGYYLLSDWLDIPNLNRRALGYVRGRIKRLLGFEDTSGVRADSPRERRIYLIYGALAGCFIVLFLGWIILRFGDFMTRRYQGTGFVIVASLVGMMFHKSLARTVARPFGWILGSRSETRTASRMRRWLRVGIGAVVLLGILTVWRRELTVSAPVTILAARHAEVRAEEEGIVEEVLVREGDEVKAGQLIARLSERNVRAELGKTEADLAAAQANLKMLEVGPREEEVDLARSEVETARMRWMQARREYETAQRMHTEREARAEASIQKVEAQLQAAREDRVRMETLVVERAVSEKQLHDAIALVSVREKELEETKADLRMLQANDLSDLREQAVVTEKELQAAQGRLTLLVAGTRPEQIEVTRATIQRLETQRDHLQEQLRSMSLVSPIDGVVTTPKLEDMRGQLVEKGDLIAEVQDVGSVRAEIAVPEKEIGPVKAGQQVVMKVRAYPGQRFEGEVTAIAPAATEDEENFEGKKILVTAELENVALALKPEMTGYAKIYCGKRRMIDLTTRRFVRYVRVEFWSWW